MNLAITWRNCTRNWKDVQKLLATTDIAIEFAAIKTGVLDNDDRHSISYQEFVNGKKWKNCDSLGFANLQASYQDGENPFQMGTVRQAKATKRKKNSLVSYQPNFQKEGKYAGHTAHCQK